MALLQRLFQNRKNAKLYNGSNYGTGEAVNPNVCVPKFDKSKVRLLIIADTEKGRVPYFDSKAIHRNEDKQSEQFDKSKVRLLIIADTEKGRVPYFDSKAIHRNEDKQSEQFDKSKVRLLIIADTEKGRVPYFDSKAIHRNEDKQSEQFDKSKVRLLIIADTEKGRVPYFDSKAIHRNEDKQSEQFDKSKVRLLIIADTEKGRVPYFDSKAIHRNEDKQSEQQKNLSRSSARLERGTNLVQSNNEVAYQFQRLGSDVKVLEEMMFGTVALAYKGSTLKVHYMRSPPQLMVTKVFYPQKPKVDSPCDLDSDSSSLTGSYTEQIISGEFPSVQRKVKDMPVTSIPVDVPVVRPSFTDSMDEDSGLASLTSSGSFQSHFPSPSNNSASSYNSLHRRWMRSQTTSLQCPARRWNSQETLNTQSPESSQLLKKKQCKLAISIVFGTSDENDADENRLFQSFFFAHMALIEGHVEQLGSLIERAFFAGRSLVPAVFEAFDKFCEVLYDLYMAPRLKEPVWLSMMSLGSYRYVLCERFVHEFMSLAAKYDNKTTKFFVSTLLSAVLTHHLAWVATVTPGDGAPSKTYLDKHSAKWIDTLAKTHPYNPLWAQLGDLYGAIGQPMKVARTVVVGRKADIVNKFLYVLSYFIRCSDVHEAPYTHCLPAILDSHCWEDPTPTPEQDVISLDGSGPYFNYNSNTDTSDINGETHSTSSLSSSSLSHSKCAWVLGQVPFERTHSCVDSEKTDSQVQCEDNCVCNRTNCETMVLECQSDDVATMEDDLNVEIHSCKRADNLQSERDEATEQEVDTCCVSAINIVENRRIEYTQHVRRSAIPSHNIQTCTEDSIIPIIADLTLKGKEKDWNAKRPTSLLSQQLAADNEAATAQLELQKAKMHEVRKQYLSGGSHSMFEEYFEEGIETKTIDDISEPQRVVKHPLACSTVNSTLVSGGPEAFVAQQKTSVSRQNSVDVKPHVSRPAALNPARCRSVTPTELNRRRHLSSTNSIDIDTFDPLLHCQEISMPTVKMQGEQSSIEAYDKNFGRSLLAGFSDHYMSDFVLHGTSDTSFRPKLIQDLQSTLQHSILDEPVAEAVGIIADTDNWTVEVASSRILDMSSTGTMQWSTSHLVANLTESVLDLYRLKMSPEFCIMHLEDRLQEMYFKSLMLAEYIKGGIQRPSHQHLTTMLGFESSDLPLLLAIAGTHSPNLVLERLC